MENDFVKLSRFVVRLGCVVYTESQNNVNTYTCAQTQTHTHRKLHFKKEGGKNPKKIHFHWATASTFTQGLTGTNVHVHSLINFIQPAILY